MSRLELVDGEVGNSNRNNLGWYVEGKRRVM
jgi:hypothetical protein